MTGRNGWQLQELHHLGMTVADIERSIEFYRDLLGMQLVGRRPCVEADYVAMQTGYEGVQLSVASFRVQPGSSQSLEVVGYLAGSIQYPCSRQTTLNPFWLKLHEKAAPDAPAPITRTSAACS